MKTGLLHPYPGSKADRAKYPIWDGGSYDCVIEPFVGSGHFTTWMLFSDKAKAAFVADIDECVRLVWRAWKNPSLRERVAKNIAEWKATALNESVIEPENTFAFLKEVLESPSEFGLDEVASASIMLRKLTFEDVLRCNKKGKLNVALNQDKFSAFEKWVFKWPWLNKKWRISIGRTWQQAFEDFEESNYQNAICLIDPPYWLPPKSRPGRRGTGAMTPVYMCHGDPSGDELFNACVMAVDRSLGNSRIKRVVVTNYASTLLRNSVNFLAQKHSCQFWTTDLGPLQSMNRQLDSRSDAPIEVAWEFGGKRTFGRYQQTSLLELAAS